MKKYITSPEPISAFVTSAWWEKLTPEGKKEYIKKYPGSKYAKEAIENPGIANEPADGEEPEAKKEEEKGPKVKKLKTTPKKPAKKAKKPSKKSEVLDEGDVEEKPKAKAKPKKAKPKAKEEQKPEAKAEEKDPEAEREALKEELKKELTEEIKEELKDHITKETSDTPDYLQPKKSLSQRFKDFLGKRKMPPAEEKFFTEGGTEPGSPARKMIADSVKAHSKEMVQYLKKEAKEWKDGMAAIHKFASKKTLDHHDKEALKAITKNILVTVAVVGIGGGLGHGILAAVTHVGFDVVKEAILKAAAHGVVGARFIRVAAASDAHDEQFMELIYNQIGKHLEYGDIDEESWMYAADSIADGEDPEEQVENTEDESDSEPDGEVDEPEAVESSTRRVMHIQTTNFPKRI